MENQHTALSVYTFEQLVAQVTVCLVFAQRSPQPEKCIGAIGFKKVYETRATKRNMFEHTTLTVAPYFPAHDSVILAIPVLDLWDSTWEVGRFKIQYGQASRLHPSASMDGPLTQDIFKQQLRLDLAFNLTQANPGPVSVPTPQALASTPGRSSTSLYVSRSKGCVLYANQTRNWIWDKDHQRYYYWSIGDDGRLRAVWQEQPTQR